MSRHHVTFLALSLALTSPLAMSAETAKPGIKASAPSSFPNLPYHSRWIGTTDRAAPTPGGKTAQGFYNPICTQPDLPCNGDPNHGDPRDAFGVGWDAILDTQVSGLTNNLERVTVFGKRESLWNALCISSECRTYELPLIDIARQSPEPISEVLFDWLFRSPRIEHRACTVLANTSSDARSTTSHSSPSDRTRAAGEIIVAYTTGANTTGMHDKKFHIIFSDGGTETYLYTVMNPTAPRSTGNLSLGDGQSKCGN